MTLIYSPIDNNQKYWRLTIFTINFIVMKTINLKTHQIKNKNLVFNSKDNKNKSTRIKWAQCAIKWLLAYWSGKRECLENWVFIPRGRENPHLKKIPPITGGKQESQKIIRTRASCLRGAQNEHSPSITLVAAETEQERKSLPQWSST